MAGAATMNAMGTLLDPFRLFGRLMVAFFKIAAYSAVFIVQIPLFIRFRRRSEIVEEFGEWGRSVTNAIAKIVE